jgi:Flp pilus assembly protein TadB
LTGQLNELEKAAHESVQSLREQAKGAARRLAKQEQVLERLSPEEKEQALQALHRAGRYAFYAWVSGLVVMTAIAVTFFVAAISPGAAVILGAMTVGTSLPLPWMLGQAFRRRLREEKLMMNIQGAVQAELDAHEHAAPAAVPPSKPLIDTIAAVREAQHALIEVVQRLARAEEASKKIKKLAKKARAALKVATQAGDAKTVQDAINTAEYLVDRIDRAAEPEEIKKPISGWFVLFSALSLIAFIILAGLVVGSPAAPALVPVCLVVGLGVRLFLLGAVLYENDREEWEKALLTPSSPADAGSGPRSTYIWLCHKLGFNKQNMPAQAGALSDELTRNEQNSETGCSYAREPGKAQVPTAAAMTTSRH